MPSLTLFKRNCDLCGENGFSMYEQNSPFIIYCNKCWWSDKWDPKNFAMDYDFSKPFFTQFRELIGKVPHISMVNDDGIASLNCEYTHDTWFAKNCYMMFNGWRIENVMYSFFMLAGRDMMDCTQIRSKNEWLYECIIARNCYQLKYSQFSLACIDSQFLYECRNCQNCFMCVSLRGKKYCFKNKQYSKEEYENILKSYQLDTWSGVEKTQKEYDSFILEYPHRYSLNLESTNTNVEGDVVSNCKNLKDCFVASKNCENCRYSDYIGTTKECFDVIMTGETQECYEGVVVDHSQLNLFGLFSVKSQDIRYTQHCHNCKHCFGCVGLRNSNYCIFNKQYTKEEYEKLVPKIIEQMNDIPYVDKLKNEYRYGEYYPIELSPFGYNETIAMEHSLLGKDEAIKKGYKWQNNIQKTEGKETLKPKDIPESIDDVKDSILDEVLACIDCKRNYKIVQNELNFYRKMNIPIPRRCFYCRHEARLKRRNPFKLWHRQCMCGGTGSPQATTNHFHGKGRCEEEFETSYAPDSPRSSSGEAGRPEIIYCEKCYQQEVY